MLQRITCTNRFTHHVSQTCQNLSQTKCGVCWRGQNRPDHTPLCADNLFRYRAEKSGTIADLHLKTHEALHGG